MSSVDSPSPWTPSLSSLTWSPVTSLFLTRLSCWTLDSLHMCQDDLLRRIELTLLLIFPRTPRWLSGKESACQCRRCRRHGFDPWVRKSLWRRKRQPTAVFMPGESYGQRSLVGNSPGGHKESDTTEHIHRVSA